MQIKKFIPNLFTLGNLSIGVILIYLLWSQDMDTNLPSKENWMLALFVLALVFDFLDGFVARWLHAYSPIGAQLDSLADLITFGVFPSMALFQITSEKFYSKFKGEIFENPWMLYKFLGFICLVLICCAAYRLAKFNVDEEQGTYFKGIASPTYGILAFFVFYNIHYFQISDAGLLFTFSIFTFIVGLMMVSNIPMFSFKMKDFSWENNSYRFIFIGLAAILFFLFNFLAIPFIIFIYIIISLIFRKKIVHA